MNDDVNVRDQRQRYLEDTYTLSVTTRVLAEGKLDDGAPWVAVEDNIAHPQGGGQPADPVLVQEAGAVPRRHELHGEQAVVLVLDVGAPSPSEGDEVTVTVDEQARLLHSALHTAGHLVDAAVRRRGFTHIVSNHFPDQARIEFEASRGLDDADAFVAAVQADVDEWVAGDLAVSSRMEGGRRFVTIGDVSTDECAGTHVAATSELRDTAVRSAKVKKGRLKVGYSAAYNHAS